MQRRGSGAAAMPGDDPEKQPGQRKNSVEVLNVREEGEAREVSPPGDVPGRLSGYGAGLTEKQSSFRNLSKSAGSLPQAPNNTVQPRAQWLAAKEQELQQREEKLVEAEAQAQELSQVRDDAERHAAELTLMEAALRDKERIHGTLEERSKKMLDREQDLEQWERQLEKRSGKCVLREAEVERASEERMKQYENLVKPLAQRERMCLEQEEDLHRRREEVLAFCKKEEERQAALRDITTRREHEVRDTRREVFEQRARLERREIEVESLKEEVSEYLRMQKKKSDELFERSRQLEWKEQESEKKVRQLAAQTTRQQERSEELTRQEEDQRLQEARLAEQQAAADELRADLATKRRRLLAADEDVQRLEKEARAKEEEVERLIEDAERRKKEADEAAETIGERGKELQAKEDSLKKREEELEKQEKVMAAARKKLETGQKELLEWMKQTEWREGQLNAREKAGKSRAGHTAPFLADPPSEQTTASKAVFPGDSTPSALVSWQLHEMKERYLVTFKRKEKEDKKALPEEPRVPFEESVSDALEVEETEKFVKRAAVVCARYLSRLRVLHVHQEELPIGATAALTRRDFTEVDRQVLDAFTSEEQVMVKEFLAHERRTRQEISFLATLNAAPLLQRMNSATDAEVIREMEGWYKKVRSAVRGRYKQVLNERASGLTQCEELFRKKEHRENDLFEGLKVRGNSGALAAEFSAVTSREQNSVRTKTSSSRIKALISTHHQRGVPHRSVRRESPPRSSDQPHRRPARLVPLQIALRQAGVKTRAPKPTQMYLRSYFEHDEEESLLDPTRPQPLEASRRRHRSSARERGPKEPAELPRTPGDGPEGGPSPVEAAEGEGPEEGKEEREGSEAPGGDVGEDPPSRPGSAAIVQRSGAPSVGSSAPDLLPGGIASRPGSGRPPPAPKPADREESGAGSEEDSRSYSESEKDD